MPIYPGRRAGTFRVVVSSHGTPHEKLIEGTKADAKKLEARMRLELGARRVSQARAVPTFSTFCLERYTPHALATLKASSWNGTRRYQVNDLVKFFGDTRLDAMTDQMVDEYKAHCAELERAPGYTNALLVALKAILAWAKRDCALPIPELRIKRVKAGKRRVRAWTNDEVRRLYACSPAWFRALLHFLFETGLRKGEAIAAQWTWVDFDARMLRIPVTEEWQPKDREERDVPLSDALMVRLRETPRSGRYLFVNQYGAPYAYFPHSTYWEARDAAGLSGGIHQTRHTFASHFLAAQPDLSLLAEVMGHSTTYVTELYAHLLPEHLNRARNAVQLAPPSEEWFANRGGRAGDGSG